MLCKKTVAIHGRKKSSVGLPTASFICATGFWFGLCIVNWIKRRKSFDCLKLVPTLAEALGSLQHSHRYGFNCTFLKSFP